MAAGSGPAGHVPKQYNPSGTVEEEIDGFLIDLDGTVYRPVPPLMYEPGKKPKVLKTFSADSPEAANDGMVGLCPGAQRFFSWLNATGKKWVLLSNTGAKGGAGTAKKLSSKGDGFCIYTGLLESPPPERPLWADPASKGPLINKQRHIWTAAEAQMKWMVDHIPDRARLFVLSGAGGGTIVQESFWYQGCLAQNAEKAMTWQIRTQLDTEEAMRWAYIAKQSFQNAEERAAEAGGAVRVLPMVYVVLFSDGKLDSDRDPDHDHQLKDWSFDVLKVASFLLQHGSYFVYSADDAFNPYRDDTYPEMVFPLPGPGMIAQMLRFGMKPFDKNRFVCCGKGGTDGHEYMMHKGVEMLKRQGHSGDPKKIMMIGDRFDTDIAGGLSYARMSGTGYDMQAMRTCLVESGTHKGAYQHFYPEYPAEFVAPDVGHLVPGSYDWYAPGDPRERVEVAGASPLTGGGAFCGFSCASSMQMVSNRDVHYRTLLRRRAKPGSAQSSAFLTASAGARGATADATFVSVMEKLGQRLRGRPARLVIVAAKAGGAALGGPDAICARIQADVALGGKMWPGGKPPSAFVAVSSGFGAMCGGNQTEASSTRGATRDLAAMGFADDEGESKYIVGYCGEADAALKPAEQVAVAVMRAATEEQTGAIQQAPALCLFYAHPGQEESMLGPLDSALKKYFPQRQEGYPRRVPVIGGSAAFSAAGPGDSWIVAMRDGGKPEKASVAVVLVWPTVDVRISSGHMFDRYNKEEHGAEPLGEVMEVGDFLQPGDGRALVTVDDAALKAVAYDDRQARKKASTAYAGWSKLYKDRDWSEEINLLGSSSLRPLAVKKGTDVADYQLVHPHSTRPDGGLNCMARLKKGQQLTVLQATESDLVGRLATLDVTSGNFNCRGVLFGVCGGLFGSHLNAADIGVQENLTITAHYKPWLAVFPFGEQYSRQPHAADVEGAGADPDHWTQHGNLMCTMVMFGDQTE